MRKESTESRSESRPEWEHLEDWVRSQVQRLIQELLEEEVTAFLGRASRRSDPTRTTIPARNGYGKARRLTLSSGTIQLRRPRVRDTEEQFESRLLPLFVNRTRKVAELIPEPCTVYPKATSWLCGGCWERRGEHGEVQVRELAQWRAGPSMTWKWSTCGWMELRQGWS